MCTKIVFFQVWCGCVCGVGVYVVWWCGCNLVRLWPFTFPGPHPRLCIARVQSRAELMHSARLKSGQSWSLAIPVVQGQDRQQCKVQGGPAGTFFLCRIVQVAQHWPSQDQQIHSLDAGWTGSPRWPPSDKPALVQYHSEY